LSVAKAHTEREKIDLPRACPFRDWKGHSFSGAAMARCLRVEQASPSPGEGERSIRPGKGSATGRGEKRAMSMEVETRLSDEIARYLDLAAAEAKLTAANMANVDTPGYRAVGLDFEAEMREALEDVEQEKAAHKVRVKAVDGLIARPDGNNVSIDRESLNLAEAQLRFKTGVALWREEYQCVMDAIHADK
jgi:flagellar basal-body rod protein FlgB